MKYNMSIFRWSQSHRESAHVVPYNVSYLEGVDVESSHWPCVPVTLSNDHVALPCHDLHGVIHDDVAVLAPCDKDTGRVTLGVHSIRTPYQFVVSVSREENMYVMNGQQENIVVCVVGSSFYL